MIITLTILISYPKSIKVLYNVENTNLLFLLLLITLNGRNALKIRMDFKI